MAVVYFCFCVQTESKTTADSGSGGSSWKSPSCARALALGRSRAPSRKSPGRVRAPLDTIRCEEGSLCCYFSVPRRPTPTTSHQSFSTLINPMNYCKCSSISKTVLSAMTGWMLKYLKNKLSIVFMIVCYTWGSQYPVTLSDQNKTIHRCLSH